MIELDDISNLVTNGTVSLLAYDSSSDFSGFFTNTFLFVQHVESIAQHENNSLLLLLAIDMNIFLS